MAGGDQDLFRRDASNRPLAARMRPRTLEEFIGQDHILAPGKLLRRAIQADMLTSIILSGPPGSGKTTLAEVIANSTQGRFTSINAVFSGVKEVRRAIEEADEAMRLHGRRTILFVDEVHRWNKAQQDALLPWVENGTVILIGATTENPYFEVNSALVSRSRIFLLTKLSEDQLSRVVESALRDTERGYGAYDLRVDQDALAHLIRVSDGDARVLLNALQLAVETTPDSFPPPSGTTIHVSLEVAEDSIQRKALLYDREGDYHFDSISAFIKSLRGSDPDAALYWMARMIAAGEDPRYLFRRLSILAAEDVGLADPTALSVVMAAAAAFDRVGMPEGQFHLAEAALYLATAEKSNTTLAYFDALAAVQQEPEQEVPRHLKDANRDAANMGHGQGYLYPHAYSSHWVEQRYLPVGLEGRVFYEPSRQGYEGRIRDAVLRRRELVLAASTEDPVEDVYAVGPSAATPRRDSWYRRLTATRVARLAEIRSDLFERVEIAAHHRVLVVGASPQLFLWEAHRRSHAGALVMAVATGGDGERERAEVELAASSLPDLERPIVVTSLDSFASADASGAHEAPSAYERILGRNYLYRSERPPALLEKLQGLLAPEGRVVLAESVSRRSTRLSRLVTDNLRTERGISDTLLEALRDAEEALFAVGSTSGAGFAPEQLSRLPECEVEIRTYRERRELEPELLRRWLNPATQESETAGPLSRELATRLSATEQERLLREVIAALANTAVEWEFAVAFVMVRPG